MARHQQKADPSRFTCTACRDGHCYECMDTIRLRVFSEPLCQCQRKKHKAEVRERLDDLKKGSDGPANSADDQ